MKPDRPASRYRVAAWCLAGVALITTGAYMLPARPGPDAGPAIAAMDREDGVAAQRERSFSSSARSAADARGSRPASAPKRRSQRGSATTRSSAAAGAAGTESGVASPSASFTAGARTLTGRLLDAETSRPLRHVEARFAFQIGGRLSSRSAPTDGEGRFRVDGLAAGDYRLRTRVAGYQPDLRRVSVGETAPIDIPLVAGLAIAGVVEDSGGRPVHGARVRWIRRDGSSSGSARRGTDEEGRFRISGLAAGSGLIEVAHRGFRAPFARRVELPRDRLVRIVLEKDHPVPLRVVDEDGRGVAGATVAWKVAGRPPGASRPPGVPRRVTTGADGRVGLEGIPAEPRALLTVSVEHPAYLRVEPSWKIGELGHAAALDPEGDLRIVLESGERVAGVVVTADGRPASRARLTLTAKDLRLSLPAATDGRFAFRRLPPGARLTLAADGGELGQAVVEGIDPTTPSSAALRVVLQAADGRLAGRVLDAGERPIALAVVEAYTETSHFTAYTAADGRFRLEGLPEGEYGLRVSSRGHGSSLRRGIPTGTTDLRFLLGAHGSLKGRASFTGPPRPFTVRMSPREPDSGERSGDLLYRFSAKDLLFECPKVPAGEYDVTLEQGDEVVASTAAVTIHSGVAAGPIDFGP